MLNRNDFKIVMLIFASIVLIWMTFYISKFKLFERVTFNITQIFASDLSKKGSIRLDEFIVQIQEKPIPGVKGLSSLTYNPDTKTLYTVSDHQSKIVELSLTGDVIRIINIEGFEEVEGIEYIGNDQYLLLEETKQKLSLITINDKTKSVSNRQRELTLRMDMKVNKGLEGIAFNPLTKTIYLAYERDPIRVYTINGFLNDEEKKSFYINNTELDRKLFIKDISGLDVDHSTGHLLVLSHESKVVIEIGDSEAPISTLSLLIGQSGLRRNIPQAEGLTMSPDGTLYIMSEPNLFYSFKKKTD